MPGQLGLTPILPPPRKTAPPQGGAGLRGSVNAGKGPRFPMPLDHPSSGLRGVSGAVSAPKEEARAAPVSSLRGLTGHTPLPFKPNPALAPRIGGRVVSPAQEQRALSQVLAQGRARLGRGPGFQEAPNQRARELKPGELGRNAPKSAGPAAFGLGEFTPGSILKGVEHIPGSALGTIVGTPGALVGLGKAGVEAVKGNTKPLGQIAKGFGETFEHPGKSFEENPVGTALMFGGTEAALARGPGELARAGAFGKTEQAGASLARPPLKLYGNLEQERQYSPDVIVKGAQKAADRFREAVFHEDPNQATGARLNRKVYGGGLLGQYLERGGVPIVGQQGFFKPGQADMVQAARMNIRQHYRHAADAFMNHIRPPKGWEEGVAPAVEGTLRSPETVREDLQGRVHELRESGQRLTGTEAAQNAAQREQYEGLLRNERFLSNPEPAFHAAEEFSGHQAPLTERKVQLGILEPDQQHATMVPYAVRHMGATYNEKPGMHPIGRAIGKMRTQLTNISKAEKTRPEIEIGSQGARQAEIKARLHDAQEYQAFMKSAGHIKPNGEMWPRLERNGKPLTNDEIVEHMRANGIPDRELGFLTHKETSYGQASEARSLTRPAIENQARTGTSYRNGTYDASWQGLHLQAYKDAQEIAAHEGRNEIVRRLGFGSYHDQEEAQRAADNFNRSPEGQDLTKAKLGPVVAVSAGPERVLSRHTLPSYAGSQMAKDFGVAIHKGVQELGPEGKWRLMPQAVVERIGEHDKLNNPTKVQRALQNYTNKWRQVALYTTPRWPVGVGQENAIRLGFAGVNPFAMAGLGPAVKLGHSIEDQWRSILADPSKTEAQHIQARANLAMVDSGMHYGSQIYNSVVRKTEANIAPEARSGMEAFTASTPVRQMLNGWTRWKNFIGTGLRAAEHNTKAALVGKQALKEAKGFTGEWEHLLTRQDAAVKAYAERKLAPAEATKLAEDIMTMAGNWTNLTPAVRKAVQTYSPFGLWWLNSMKFIFQTLPKDHPMKIGVLAALVAGTGSGKALPNAPGYEAGGVGVTLPIVGPITYNFLHYSPAGIGIEPIRTAAGMIFPQFSDAALTSVGLKPLSYEPEAPSKYAKIPEGVSALKGLEAFPEGLVPGARPAISILRGGGKPVPGSLNPIATKPGTQMGMLPAALKFLSPVPFTFNKKATGRAERPERPERAERKERPERAERPERK